MKKLGSKGFTHNVVMFAILALILGVMGYAGYRVYKNRNIDAKASNVPAILSQSTYYGTVTIRGCKSSSKIASVSASVKPSGKLPALKYTTISYASGGGKSVAIGGGFSVTNTGTFSIGASTSAYPNSGESVVKSTSISKLPTCP